MVVKCQRMCQKACEGQKEKKKNEQETKTKTKTKTSSAGAAAAVGKKREICAVLVEQRRGGARIA